MSERHYTVYKITNIVNGKIYVGKHHTLNLDDGYMGSGQNLKRALAKYGVENFRKEILFDFDNSDDMNSKEIEIVNEEFVARGDTYNLSLGGAGTWDYVNKMGLRTKMTPEIFRKRKTVFGGNVTSKYRWANDGSRNMYLKPDQQLPENFEYGRLCKFRDPKFQKQMNERRNAKV